MAIEVLSWCEVVAVCGSRERARRMVREGVYRKVFHDAYVLSDVPDDVHTRAAALRKVLPEDVALSHWGALWALGLDVLPRDKQGVDILDVTVTRGRHLLARPGVRPHCALVTDEELCDIEGLLVVSAARAFVDVARSLGVVEGVACGDAALRAGATTMELIEEAVERAGALRWVTRAREAVPHLEPRSESLMESRLRVGFVLEGGPRMHAQLDLYDDVGAHRGRGDLFLDGVLVEYDGREERLKREKFTHDRRRGNSVADLEVEVRRFSADDYYKTSAVVRLDTLRRALAIARGRTRPRLRFGSDTLPRPKLRPLPTRADRLARAA